MNDYDLVAADYDRHFNRPVDRWEDERLATILALFVNGSDVLDLGCGTGWLLDHLRPRSYVGVDASSAMLARLYEKHLTAITVKATVGEPGWAETVADATWGRRFNVVTATWSAHELGDLGQLLVALDTLAPGALVALHGQGPRYAHRPHYVLPTDDRRGYLNFTPRACEEAAEWSEATRIGLWGTGACPDVLARWKPLWRLFLNLPAEQHYAFVVVFRL